MNDPSPLSNESSFAELMGRHQPRLIGYIRSMIPDPHASKDILQETNMTLLRKHGEFQKGSNFTAWAFRIAYFEVLNWRRNQGRDRLQFSNELVESIAQAGEEMAASYDSRLEALKTCLEKLPERQRTVVQQHYLNGTPVQDVAREMNFKANAASQLLHRARLNLFKCINQVTKKS